MLLTALMVSESPRFSKYGFAIEKASNLIDLIMQHGGFFVAERDGEIIGFFAGVVSEQFLSYDKTASDIGVYVVPEHRGTSAFQRLIHAFETWALEQGAADMVLGISTEVHTEKTVCMYERLGYKMSSFGLIKAGV